MTITSSITGLTAPACNRATLSMCRSKFCSQLVVPPKNSDFNCPATTTTTAPPTTTTTIPASGCRVTGGGIVDACGPGASGCDPNTPGSCAPDSCAETALNATHGGQVGAPVGIATAFDAGPNGTGSACIRGNWTHVRHIRPSLNGNFHARTYDSLMCACLACQHCSGDETKGCRTEADCIAQGTTGPCLSESSQGVVGTLCNPGDRICGPEPPRAPANKICFSGVGNYALTHGKRTKGSVIFRVDIEDRSEPGGTNGPPPPDRYRMRMWFVQNSTSNLGDPDTTGTPAFMLREQVACANAAEEALTITVPNASTPDIDDGGDLLRGNHQIHPPIRTTCP